MAPSLGFLKHIHLGGCPKVTQNGIIDLLSENSVGIEEMALEGVSPTFVSDFGFSISSCLNLFLEDERTELVLYEDASTSLASINYSCIPRFIP